MEGREPLRPKPSRGRTDICQQKLDYGWGAVLATRYGYKVAVEENSN
jgi:hypothetical protein